MQLELNTGYTLHICTYKPTELHDASCTFRTYQNRVDWRLKSKLQRLRSIKTNQAQCIHDCVLENADGSSLQSMTLWMKTLVSSNELVWFVFQYLFNFRHYFVRELWNNLKHADKEKNSAVLFRLRMLLDNLPPTSSSSRRFAQPIIHKESNIKLQRTSSCIGYQAAYLGCTHDDCGNVWILDTPCE